MKIKLELKWNDLWVGAYHILKSRHINPNAELPRIISTYFRAELIFERHVWICLLPCLPIHIWWEKT